MTGRGLLAGAMRFAANRRPKFLVRGVGYLVEHLTVDELIALCAFFQDECNAAVARAQAATGVARDAHAQEASDMAALRLRPKALLVRLGAALPDPRSEP